MRKPRHFSPTSYALWRVDQQEYYRRYLSERRFAKELQSLPMAIGSAFDFLVKEHLNACLGSKLGSPGELATTMEKQVEGHNMPEAATLGAAVMKAYTDSGALAALKSEIVSGARFEFGITAQFNTEKELVCLRERDPECSVPGLFLNGRPDGHFYTKANYQSEAVPVILDWKVNGWQSAQKSPDTGFLCVHSVDGKVSGPHKDCFVGFHAGVKVNKSLSLNVEWQTQLAVYAWVLGIKVGTPVIGCIDQVIGPSFKPRVARHRFLIGEEFQHKLFDAMYAAWAVVNSDHIFRDVSRDESVARCSMLENQVIEAAPSDDNLNFDWR